MKNSNLLIGGGVVVVSYLLWKKSKKDELNKGAENIKNLANSLLNTTTTESKVGTTSSANIKNPFGATTPKIIIGDTNNAINPNNTQGVSRITNDIAIDKLPNIVNQEDIQLFFWNNSNIKFMEGSGNTIYDSKYKPIYQKIQKSDVKKDEFGNIVSGNSNEGYFYKQDGKYYLKTPYSYGSEICEISENDYVDFFVNIKNGSYKKLNSPSIQKINCKSTFNGGSWR